eukprot:TRINITY_DN5758_c0_g1_i1.p1 TRINITY_DN5758_c0_g1~~TRINITY_DN5758_c0_g1_i1.p1  ORF type:complete len:1245 (+),score=414.85 TRINITY_DN5758_c0_g1_i1:54-3788(+)
MSLIPLPLVEGALEVKGTLSQNPNAKKSEKYWFVLSDGVLAFYNLDNTTDKKGKKEENNSDRLLIDVVPLTYLQLEEVNKKDKTSTNFAFVLSSEKRKFRTVFCADKQEELDQWKKGLTIWIPLAHSEIFKSSITDACYKSNKYIPAIVEMSVNEIDKHLQTEGLFRVPGDWNVVTATQEQFDKGLLPDLVKSDPHMICGLLKSYVRGLAEPIVPEFLYRSCMSCTSYDDLKKLFDQLPPCNRATLGYILHFLKRVEKESAKNLMDVSNLATVFGPTIIRNTADENSGKPAGLEEMAISNQVIKMMISNAHTLFSVEELANCTNPLLDVNNEMSKERVIMNHAEKASIEAVLIPHHEYVRNDGTKISVDSASVWEKTICCLVNFKTSKGKNETLEPRLFVADHNRIFIFLRGGGKPEYEFHLLDLLEVDSPSKHEVNIQFSTVSSEKKSNISITIHPISYALFDIDLIVEWIHKQWEMNFIGRPNSEKFKLKIHPTSRKDELSQFVFDDKEAGCSGLVRAYISVSDWMGAPVLQEVIWDLENYFYPNNHKVFNMYDILHKDKFPCPEYEAMVFSLKYNQWFTVLDCSGCSLGNDAVITLSSIFETNSTITTLILKDAGAKDKAITSLCEAVKKNSSCSIHTLNIAGNVIESKKVVADFSQTLKTQLGKLRSLDISNAKIIKISPLIEGLAGAPSLMDGLRELNLSSNNLDAESSLKIGIVLSMTRALSILSLSGTSAVWQSICDGMLEPKRNTTVGTLDLSRNPTKPKFQKGMCDLLAYLPNVTSLNLADTAITPESIHEILISNPKITDLDLSENEFSDEGVISIMKGLRDTSTTASHLTKLQLNKVFKNRSKLRPEAMRGIAATLNKTAIRQFFLNGNKLKGDLNDLLTRLLNNQTLVLFDISGNSGGDDLAGILSKVFQHNHTLHTLFWDGNDTTVTGLKKIKLGLARNDAIKHMPLPLLDVAHMLKNSETNTDEVVELVKDIQKLIFDKFMKVDLTQPPKLISLASGLPPPPPPSMANLSVSNPPATQTSTQSESLDAASSTSIDDSKVSPHPSPRGKDQVPPTPTGAGIPSAVLNTPTMPNPSPAIITKSTRRKSQGKKSKRKKGLVDEHRASMIFGSNPIDFSSTESISSPPPPPGTPSPTSTNNPNNTTSTTTTDESTEKSQDGENDDPAVGTEDSEDPIKSSKSGKDPKKKKKKERTMVTVSSSSVLSPPPSSAPPPPSDLPPPSAGTGTGTEPTQ